ncbi:ABC transporter permease [Treponema sp. TIM-1]|uniref:ABC transporter permease n=1 Tax=Treponema sp. TIM-1 TaxID=2898417 RepID=UPI00397EAC27
MQTQVRSKKFSEFIKKQALLIGLLAIIVFFSLVTDNFFSVSNLMLVLQQAAVVGIASCAMTFVLIAGNFDLSMGATITLSVLLSIDLHDKLGPLPAVLIALAACVLVGMCSGFFVGYLRVHSMVITLGMMSILTGTMLLYTGGGLSWVDNPSATWFRVFGRDSLFGIPVQVILLLVFIGIFEFILNKTTFGIKVQAVGGNADAVRFSGLNDKQIVLATFILSGLMSGIAGLVMASRTMQYQTGIAFGYEFNVLSAVILGGTSLSGGKGSVYGSLLGVLIIIALTNGFLMIGLPYYFQWVMQGLVIVVIVWIDISSRYREGLA